MEPTSASTKANRDPGGRILAVFALVAATVVVIVVVTGTLGGSGSSDAGSRSSEEQAKPSQPYYVVQPGESLTTVHDKFHLPLPEIERLNPNLDPQQVPTQACVNLVPEGCKKLTGG